MPEFLFWCFLVNFTELVRTPFLQNSTGQLFLIIAVSIVAKEVLANETVIMIHKLRHIPVGTRPKMNVFCTFKIGLFVPIKKDVFWTSFRCPENKFCLSSECVSIAIYIYEEDCYLLIFRETF